MECHETEANLSQISTHWGLVFEARSGTPEQVSIALSRLMARYAGAVHRYLLRTLPSPETADELSGEFAARFLRGDFLRYADPGRGRFRDFVKRALLDLMRDYYRRRRRAGAVPVGPGASGRSELDDCLEQFDRQFLRSWLNDLLDRTWRALDELEHETGHPHHTILRLRVDEPGLGSEQWAARLSERIGHPVSPGAFRRGLQRARREFAFRLIAEVRASLNPPTRESLEQELADLELLEYCRPYLKHMTSAVPSDVPTVGELAGRPEIGTTPEMAPEERTDHPEPSLLDVILSVSRPGSRPPDHGDAPAAGDPDDAASEARARFLAEVAGLGELRHPGLLPIQPVAIRRHTDVSFPAVVQVGKVYNLRVQLVPAEDALPSGEVRSRPRPHAHDATLNLLVAPPQSDEPSPPIRLSVSVTAENFEIQGPARAEMIVPPEGNSPAITFGLRGLDVGPGRVMIDFAQDGRPAGSVDLAPVIVADGAARLAATVLPSVALDLDLHVGPAPAIPDVVLKVFEHRLAGLPGRLHFVLSSSHPALSDLPVLDGDLGTLDLRTDVAGWIEGQLRAVESLVECPAAPTEDPERALAAVGFNLYEHLLPAPVQELSWIFRRRGIKTLLILSDDPHIPWELIKPFRSDFATGEIGTEDSYWGEAYALTHWLRGRPPVPRLSVSRVVGVAASGGDRPEPGDRPGPASRVVRAVSTRDMVRIDATAVEIGPSVGPGGAGADRPGPSMPADEPEVDPDAPISGPNGRPEGPRAHPDRRTIWDEEMELLRSLEALGARVERLPALRPVLRRAFEEGSFDLLHLVGHGAFGGMAAGDATAVFLDDGLFTAAELSPRMAGPLRRCSPLVLFNTCHCGRSGFSLTRLGSWGAHLVRLGCGAFIGALWPVSEGAALGFARAFYGHLARNCPLGEAVRLARLVVREQYPGDPTWLAYRCFADPMAKLAPGGTPGYRSPPDSG